MTPALPLPHHARHASFIAGGIALLPLLLQLPRSSALAIAVVGGIVLAASWRRPLPGWLKFLLALTAIGGVLINTRFGVGRDTGCAMLAAMLAIKPAETRSSRDARSLIGFGLFAPFATFLLDQGPVSMVLGLVAALVGLAALSQVADADAGLASHHSRLRGALLQAGRYALLGLPLALAVFWLFPRLATPLWGVPERALGKGGLGDTMTPGPWLDLLSDDRTAMRVQFQGAMPPVTQLYWRGPVLIDFDGKTWRREEAAPASSSSATTQPRWRYQLDMEATDRRDIYALDWPTALPADTQQQANGTVTSTRLLAGTTRWQLAAGPTPTTTRALMRHERARLLALPEGNPRSVALAKRWRAEAGDDDPAVIDKAMRLINAEFAYSLDVGSLGSDAVDEFLFQTKTGYCQHFSSSFVVLMRAAGIPSRVVTGFVGGVRNPMGNYWIVRNSDAHAWAEVWLDGRGWVRVDPTAAVAPERIYDTLADRASVGGALGNALPAIAPMFNFADWARRSWNDMVLGYNAERQQQLLRRLSGGRWDEGALSALFVLAVLGSLLGMALWLRRGQAVRDPVLAAWDRLSRRFAPMQLQRAPHETPAAWLARLNASGWTDPALQSLSQRFASWRYACGEKNRHERAALIRDLRRYRPVRS